MRVGVVGPIYDDSFAENVVVTLQQMGYDAVSLGSPGLPVGKLSAKVTELARRFGAEAEQLTQRAVVARAARARCDVVISILHGLMPDIVAALKDVSDKVCLWYPDAVANVGRMAMAAAPYDALFFKDSWLAQRLRDVYGLPAHYLPEACNPTWHRPIGDYGREPHIVVVGSVYPTRARLLERLIRDGVPLKIHGNGLPRWLAGGALADVPRGAYIAREEKAAAFRRARGVLNNLHPGEMVGVNCRLFEAAASGGAVLCERRDGLGDVFDEPSEVLAFSSYDELLGHCRTLLAGPDVGRAVGAAASERARHEHSYERRLTAMLGELHA
ncbi:Spore maturation protein CgeB [Jatrophihabitans endophyticus]|uniref:Spore maturation protein CgeB n=1 Tax=Jatrophihabitans endophyticus TaxID=1206085 RepID=A0A1M5INH0_9ACTN|nr:glycosyltransferase [Jatrophihabitans endophyticus]SHG29795.1 Spore maturation protein CgeB [Jatrophihabitans endophyticus]